MRFSSSLLAGWFLFLLIAVNARGENSDGTAVSTQLTAIERQTFSLINDVREKEGLPRFSWDAKVALLARAHSEAMATGSISFGHAGFSNRMAALRQSFPGMQGGAENVFMTSLPADPAGQAVRGWLQSPAHRHNIMSENNVSGIGLAVSARGWIYFTQIFIRNTSG